MLGISFSGYTQDKTNVTDTMGKRILVAFFQEQAKITVQDTSKKETPKSLRK